MNTKFLSRKERARRQPDRPTSSLATNTGLRAGKGRPGDNDKFMKPLAPLDATMKSVVKDVTDGTPKSPRRMNVSDLQKEGRM